MPTVHHIFLLSLKNPSITCIEVNRKVQRIVGSIYFTSHDVIIITRG
jgi:hypothetical protein